MLKRFLIAAAFLFAACQPTAPTETSTAIPATPQSDGGQELQWLETEMNGVSLGIWKPSGWETDLTNGLVLAEHTNSTNSMVDAGMLVYVFVPPIDEFEIGADDNNIAWTLLNQVVKMPSHTGSDVTVSVPAGFDWDQYGAAYYLMSSGDGIKALVLALALSKEPPKVVVCNVSVPSSQASRIRAMLPTLLDGLTINGRVFDGTLLGALPDPLPFPAYNIMAISGNNHVVSGGSPEDSPHEKVDQPC